MSRPQDFILAEIEDPLAYDLMQFAAADQSLRSFGEAPISSEQIGALTEQAEDIALGALRGLFDCSASPDAERGDFVQSGVLNAALGRAILDSIDDNRGRGNVPADYEGIETRYTIAEHRPFALLVKHIYDTSNARESALVVGVSGYGGSGKSSLAVSLTKALTKEEPATYMVPIDHYFTCDKKKQLQRTADWASYDFPALFNEVIGPARRELPIRYQTSDWLTGQKGPMRVISRPKILIVEGVGLFSEQYRNWYDIRIIAACPRAVATNRGRIRDNGNPDDWEVWSQNERDFNRKHRPRRSVKGQHEPIYFRTY